MTESIAPTARTRPLGVSRPDLAVADPVLAELAAGDHPGLQVEECAESGHALDAARTPPRAATASSRPVEDAGGTAQYAAVTW